MTTKPETLSPDTRAELRNLRRLAKAVADWDCGAYARDDIMKNSMLTCEKGRFISDEKRRKGA